MASPYRNFRPFFFGVFAVAVCWFAPAALKRCSYESFQDFSAPAFLATSHAKDLARYWGLRSRTKHELIEAGRDAERTAATMQLEMQTANALREENRRLEKLLSLPSRPDVRTVVARVARREVGLWWQQLVIRRGKADGIRVGAPVVDAGGVVGRVREVYHFTSVVELISSPSFRISAYIEGSDYPVTFRGAGSGPFSSPFGMIRDIPSDFPAKFERDPAIVTQGVGGVIPGGLRLGTMRGGMRPTDDGLFCEARVALRPGLAAVEEVAVLVPVKTDPTEYNEWEAAAP